MNHAHAQVICATIGMFGPFFGALKLNIQLKRVKKMMIENRFVCCNKCDDEWM